MPHALDGARFKVVRAQEHLDTLQAEIGRYLHEQPHEIRSERTKHPYPAISDFYSLPSVVPAVPPLRLSAIIGDCVTNARAALDYIVWEFAQRYFDPPVQITNRNDRRITSFPIFDTPTEAGLKDRLNALANRKIPTPAIDQIKSVQPYNAGYKPLCWLHELVNSDKHRMLLLTVGEVDNVTVTLSTPPIFQDLTRAPATFTIPRQHATVEAAAFQSNVEMKGEFTVYVTWKDVAMPREPVDRTLEQIIERVADIVPRFDPFF